MLGKVPQIQHQVSQYPSTEGYIDDTFLSERSYSAE